MCVVQDTTHTENVFMELCTSARDWHSFERTVSEYDKFQFGTRAHCLMK